MPCFSNIRSEEKGKVHGLDLIFPIQSRWRRGRCDLYHPNLGFRESMADVSLELMEEAEEKDSGAGSKRTRRKVVRILESGKSKQTGVVGELARLERRIFPKHESLADSLDKELQKRNLVVLYTLENDYWNEDENLPSENEKQPPDGEGRAVAGYLMYSCTSVMASISKLAVRENCRRQGYGEALIKAALDKARSKRVLCVTLHVDPLRTPALSLYRKLGFEVDTLIHSYYAPSRDAYRMVLTFDSDAVR